MITKRMMLVGIGTATVVGGVLLLPSKFRLLNRPASRNAAGDGNRIFEVHRTEAEWQALLSEDQYAVLRLEGTERKESSPLLHEKRSGTYHCTGCELAVYRSTDKYDSKTGWPSFTRAIDGAIGTKPDDTLFIPRTEVHCRRCGGHLGHIFDDGPQPTGDRHCINGLALTFVAA